MTSVTPRYLLSLMAGWALLLLCPAQFHAQNVNGAHAPLGVYAHVNIEDAIHGYLKLHYPKLTPGPCYSLPATVESAVHTYLKGLYKGLLQDPAVSGIAVGAHWCLIQRHKPNSKSDGNDWSYLDDVFNVVAPPQTVQLIITPGVNSPSWLLDNVLKSCDGLFPVHGKGAADPNCDMVTFSKLPESGHAEGNKFPLPWSPTYISYWYGFLADLRNKYQSFASIAIAGPNGASPEMILPTTANLSGLKVGKSKFYEADDMWTTLIANAVNGSAFKTFPNRRFYVDYPEQVFVDSWNLTIDAYQRIFSGVTLTLLPDTGTNLPSILSLPSTSLINGVDPVINSALLSIDCNNTDTSKSCQPQALPCQVKVEVLTHFTTSEKSTPFPSNEKSTDVGGMRAGSCTTLGNIGVPGVKLLTGWPSPPLPPPPPPSSPFLGGAQFDFAVSQGKNTHVEGCAGSLPCKNPEEDAFNVLNVFFDCTGSGLPFALECQGSPMTHAGAPIQYVDLDYVDIQYAQANPCPLKPPVVLGVGGKPSCTSLQDLLNWTQYYLFSMAGKQPTTQPTPTCPYLPANNCQP